MNIIMDAAYLITSGGLIGAILGALAGGILIGIGIFLLITKLRKKGKKVKINNTKSSDYQFNFKLNTGQFMKNLKDNDSKE